MAFKRKRGFNSVRLTRNLARRRNSYRKKGLAKRARGAVKRVVKKVLASRVETKSVLREICKNTPMLQNTVVFLNNNAFYSQVNVFGKEIQDIAGHTGGARIGDELFAKGMQVSVLIEAQQYRPLTTVWLYLVRNKYDGSNDLNNKNEIFEGRSTLIPMDYIDTNKVHIQFAKKWTLRMPNGGTSTLKNTGAGIGDPPGTYFDIKTDETWTLKTNPQKIEKFYIPLKRKIKYRAVQDGDRVLPIPDHQYQWIAVAYDNYAANIEGGATPAAVAAYPVAHISVTTKLLFTDM